MGRGGVGLIRGFMVCHLINLSLGEITQADIMLTRIYF